MAFGCVYESLNRTLNWGTKAEGGRRWHGRWHRGCVDELLGKWG
jgi:hypothetical protein